MTVRQEPVLAGSDTVFVRLYMKTELYTVKLVITRFSVRLALHENRIMHRQACHNQTLRLAGQPCLGTIPCKDIQRALLAEVKSSA